VGSRGRGWLVPAVALLAFVARLLPMLRGGGLGGSDGYDDSVYYAAATALVHGRMPYDDFVLLHPAGLILVLAPFAVLARLTSDAFGQEAARVGFMALGALNAVLVLRIGRRFSIFVGALAGIWYAVFYPAVYAERTTTLEALGTTTLLLALVALVRTERAVSGWSTLRLVSAGAALGVGVGVKIWGVVPLLIITGWVLICSGWGPAAKLVAAAASATTVVCLPFFVQAPALMVRYVVSDQLARPRDGLSVVQRLTEMTGAQVLVHHGPAPVTGAAVLLVLAAVAAASVVALRTPGAGVLVGLLLGLALLLLAGPSFYFHYATLTAVPGVLTLALGAAAARRRVAAAGLPALAAFGALTALAVTVAVGIPGILHRQGTAIPAPVAAAGTRTTGCITADDPAYLIGLNVLSRDLEAGCPVWIDVTGLAFDKAGGNSGYANLGHNRLWQHKIMGYLLSGRATIITRSTTALNQRSRAHIRALHALARSHGITLERT